MQQHSDTPPGTPEEVREIEALRLENHQLRQRIGMLEHILEQASIAYPAEDSPLTISGSFPVHPSEPPLYQRRSTLQGIPPVLPDLPLTPFIEPPPTDGFRTSTRRTSETSLRASDLSRGSDPQRGSDPGLRASDRTSDPGLRASDRTSDPGLRASEATQRKSDPGQRKSEPGQRKSEPPPRKSDPQLRSGEPAQRTGGTQRASDRPVGSGSPRLGSDPPRSEMPKRSSNRPSRASDSPRTGERGAVVQLPNNGPWGVLALDTEGCIAALNPMASEMLRLPRDLAKLSLFDELCPALAGTTLHQAFLQIVRDLGAGEATPLRVKVPAIGGYPALTVVVAQRAGAPHQVTLIAQRDEG